MRLGLQDGGGCARGLAGLGLGAGGAGAAAGVAQVSLGLSSHAREAFVVTGTGGSGPSRVALAFLGATASTEPGHGAAPGALGLVG